MNTGLFFGSFNPIHIGHLMIANYILSFENLDSVCFVVSPQNPLKDETILISNHHRLKMVDIAIEKYNKLQSSDIEFTMPKPSYTVDTLFKLRQQNPTINYSLITGEDNYENFHKWKNYKTILNNHKVIVYPRNRQPVKSKIKSDSFIISEAPLIEISSTFIRESIKNNKNVEFMLPKGVYAYIIENNLYI